MIVYPDGYVGSSPLTRGKLERMARGWTCTRLIPAHAGKTGGYPPGYAGTQAHPRSRGENSLGGPSAWSALGSSPLTRGKHNTPPHIDAADRLIPAHAGKTGQGQEDEGLDGGSSPLTRGKQHRIVPHEEVPGLIPAHAGKTRQHASHTGGRPAHPRSRGENIDSTRAFSSGNGSSPLTRGKPMREFAARPEIGLIPAHAGKTLGGPPCSSSCRAHPRSRGENTL